MSETQVSDVGHLSVKELAESASIAEDLLDKLEPSALTEAVRDRRKVYLDELVARGALTHYSFV